MSLQVVFLSVSALLDNLSDQNEATVISKLLERPFHTNVTRMNQFVDLIFDYVRITDLCSPKCLTTPRPLGTITIRFSVLFQVFQKPHFVTVYAHLCKAVLGKETSENRPQNMRFLLLQRIHCLEKTIEKGIENKEVSGTTASDLAENTRQCLRAVLKWVVPAIST